MSNIKQFNIQVILVSSFECQRSNILYYIYFFSTVPYTTILSWNPVLITFCIALIALNQLPSFFSLAYSLFLIIPMIISHDYITVSPPPYIYIYIIYIYIFFIGVSDLHHLPFSTSTLMHHLRKCINLTPLTALACLPCCIDLAH